jgi:hypothetical protein
MEVKCSIDMNEFKVATFKMPILERARSKCSTK